MAITVFKWILAHLSNVKTLKFLIKLSIINKGIQISLVLCYTSTTAVQIAFKFSLLFIAFLSHAM